MAEDITKTVRTIHHLSATGGTLISKCVAAMQGVYLLSEVTPLTVQGVHFNPIDPLQQAVAQYRTELGFRAPELGSAFLERLAPVVDKVVAVNGTLVLRDHSHSDWLRPTPRSQCSLTWVLRARYAVRPVLTLRNPVESYLGMTGRGWHKGVGSFDEYCRRIHLFLDHFGDAPAYHYEEFVEAPDRVLADIAGEFGIAYDPSWRSRFNAIRLSGDSGRGGQDIRPLPMRPVPSDLAEAVRCSEQYASLCERLGYIRDPDALQADRARRAGTG